MGSHLTGSRHDHLPSRYLPQEVEAAAQVVDRALTRGRRAPEERAVLLEDIPAGIAGTLELDDHFTDCDVTGAERLEETLLHRLDQLELAGAEAHRDSLADVLEVGVRDPARERRRDRERARAAESEMSRVQAHAHVRAFEHAQDVMVLLDERPPVRV